VSAKTQERIRDIALAAHEALGCVDLSRADLIVTDAEEIVLLEVNTLPGMTPTSLYPDGARAIGLTFEALVDALVSSALERGVR
jgi:D-alanine-D-alanine ligase